MAAFSRNRHRMPLPKNMIPVYGADHELLYTAPISSVPRLLASGRVRAVGTRHRIRALLATGSGTEGMRLARPMTGQRFSHRQETDDNPRGVWTFRKLSL